MTRDQVLDFLIRRPVGYRAYLRVSADPGEDGTDSFFNERVWTKLNPDEWQDDLGWGCSENHLADLYSDAIEYLPLPPAED